MLSLQGERKQQKKGAEMQAKQKNRECKRRKQARKGEVTCVFSTKNGVETRASSMGRRRIGATPFLSAHGRG